MAQIKGIFEPFNSYVTNQLNFRRALLNSRNKDGLNKIPFRNLPNFESFAKTFTEKQCTIRLCSAVDIRPNSAKYNVQNILESDEKGLTGGKLAKRWILEGGIKSLSDRKNRGGIGESGAYGSSEIRSDAKEGFGIVPMPGIISADISTRSEDGSLRDAKVNFVCYNRRQLEVLEALYMRPGYPLLLEWGWDPYVKSNGTIHKTGFPLIEEFFLSSATFESINKKIRKQKITSEGNYDGFVGYIKNFAFKVREDGGYDCTTEIVAQGEILESLKSPIKMVPKVYTDKNIFRPQAEASMEGELEDLEELEAVDGFLYYLRSLKANLDRAGYKAVLQYLGTKYQTTTEVGSQVTNTLGTMTVKESDPNIPREPEDLGLRVVANSQSDTYTSTVGGMGGYSGTATYTSDMEFFSFTNEEGYVLPIYQLNKVSETYLSGSNEIKNLIEDVAKLKKGPIRGDLAKSELGWEEAPSGLKTNNSYYKKGTKDNPPGQKDWDPIGVRDIEGLGVDSMWEGTILKEFSVEEETEDDSGIKKKIFVRWDLLCQIINQLVAPHYKSNHPIVELTYLKPNQQTYSPTKSEKKLKNPNGISSYITYSPPKFASVFPYEAQGLSHTHYTVDPNLKSDSAVFLEGTPGTFKNVMSGEVISGVTGDFTIINDAIVPVKELEDLYTTQTPVPSDAPGGTAGAEAGGEVVINKGEAVVAYPPLLGRSYDSDICLMPHQLQYMDQTLTAGKGGINTRNFTSFNNVTGDVNSIGFIYFNLDYIIETYESLVLEEYKTDLNGVVKYKRRLKGEFNFHDFITTIWNGVNDATAGYYDFGLHLEHERPNVARIIDFTFSGATKDFTTKTMFEFNPQGTNSITRDHFFSSKLDNDFAALISIAAQSPNNIYSLEATSFRAFHKGIKNRFTASEQDLRDAEMEEAGKRYKEDFKEYRDTVNSLIYFIYRQNICNYESDLVDGDTIKLPMSSETAKTFARRLEQQRLSLYNRYPEKGEDGKKNDGSGSRPYVGQWREGTTQERTAIIPLTTTLKIDGIGGISPLNLFKINKDKLPKGYQDSNIAFVVKKETQKITAGQDWTTDLTGYLTLLNDNPMPGKNETILVSDLRVNKLDSVQAAAEKWKEFVSDTPWSAVFVSYVIQAALGKGAFESSASHTGYFNKNRHMMGGLYRYVVNPKFDSNAEGFGFRKYGPGVATPDEPPYAYPRDETGIYHQASIIPGDILLQPRNNNVAGTKYRGTYESDYFGDSHADIVTWVSSTGTVAEVIGGNLGGTVKSKFIKLDGKGRLTPDAGTEGGNGPYLNGSILRLSGCNRYNDDEYTIMNDEEEGAGTCRQLGNKVAFQAGDEWRKWNKELIPRNTDVEWAEASYDDITQVDNSNQWGELTKEAEPMLRQYYANNPSTAGDVPEEPVL